MSFCPQCGHNLADGVKFCPSCGTPAPQPVVAPAPQPVVAAPAPQPVVAAPAPQPVVAPAPQPVAAPAPQPVADPNLRQKLAAMSKEELLPQLYKAEQLVQAMQPCQKRIVATTARIKELNIQYDDSKGDAAHGLTGMITTVAVALVIFLITLIEPASFFGSALLTLFKIFAIFLYIGAVVVFIKACGIFIAAKTALSAISTQITQENTVLAATNAEIDALRHQNPESNLILTYACPHQCTDPQLMRMFVRYIEDGRATNLNEAHKLFEEYSYLPNMYATF